MPKTKNPRHGSMQFWPRVRAKRAYARVRHWAASGDKPSLLGFPCYKVGMTHIVGIDNRKASPYKGEEISLPATVLECPPIRILSLRFYKKKLVSQHVDKEIMFKPAKQLDRKIVMPKKAGDVKDLEGLNPEDYYDITALVYTQPWLIGLKKTPEVVELRLGGKVKDKLDYLKELLNKDIRASDIFGEGVVVDVHGITKGKGTQGPVKRFGITLKPSKSEKTRRNPGSLGGWISQAHVMYRVAHAGQTGYQQRTEYNKQILMISNEVDKVNPKGGFNHYGDIRSDYVLLHGSAQGPAKRLLLLTRPMRSFSAPALPTIQYISKVAK